IGTLTLNANPSNFFAETEQVAFHPGHVVRGIDFTNDPLLQGRLFSYLDTQISRLGGPNFAQLPINRPHTEINDMFRDGMHQTAVHTGVAPYRPNSLDGGCPFTAQPGEALIEFPDMVNGAKARQAPASFDDHFSGARLFYASLTDIEKKHIADAYSFELGKCYEKAIKQRAVDVLRNVDEQLARTVAGNLGLPAPDTTDGAGAGAAAADGAVTTSAALAQIGERWPTDGRIIGIVVDDDIDVAELADIVEQISGSSMVPLVLAAHGGEIGSGKRVVPISRTLDTARSVEFDALLVAASLPDPKLTVLLQEAHRHLKAIAYTPAGEAALQTAGIAGGF